MGPAAPRARTRHRRQLGALCAPAPGARDLGDYRRYRGRRAAIKFSRCFGARRGRKEQAGRLGPARPSVTKNGRNPCVDTLDRQTTGARSYIDDSSEPRLIVGPREGRSRCSARRFLPGPLFGSLHMAAGHTTSTAPVTGGLPVRAPQRPWDFAVQSHRPVFRRGRVSVSCGFRWRRQGRGYSVREWKRWRTFRQLLLGSRREPPVGHDLWRRTTTGRAPRWYSAPPVEQVVSFWGRVLEGDPTYPVGYWPGCGIWSLALADSYSSSPF